MSAVLCCTVCFVALALSLCVAEVNVIPARPRACDVIPARLVGVFRTMYCLGASSCL